MNNVALMNMLDNDHNTRPPSHSTKNKQFFYAVSTGRTVGIFDEWAEAHASIIGYSHAAQKKTETREEAEAYLANNQGFTPSHEQKPKSYRRAADISPMSSHNTDQHPLQLKNSNHYNNNEDNESMYSKSTSRITLSTIRTECPQAHLVTLEMLISSGAELETLKKVVSDWSKDTPSKPNNH